MNIRFKSAIFCAYPKHGPRFPSSNICSLTPHKHQCLSYIGEEHCLSRNWVINTFSNTGIWFLHMWIIRDRDESASGYEIFCQNLPFGFLFLSGILTICGWIHMRVTTIGALRILITIKALVVFFCTLTTFQFPFTLTLAFTV